MLMPPLDSVSAAAALASATAWRGPELAQATASWVHELGEADICELQAAVEATAQLPIAQVSAHEFPLPTLGPRMRRIKQSLLSGPGIALLRNLPTTTWGAEASARAFWLLGLHLGETTPVPQNAKGHLLGHVYDLGNDPTKPETRIYTTCAAQPYHTDSADLVGLMCLRDVTRAVDGDASRDGRAVGQARVRAVGDHLRLTSGPAPLLEAAHERRVGRLEEGVSLLDDIRHV